MGIDQIGQTQSNQSNQNKSLSILQHQYKNPSMKKAIFFYFLIAVCSAKDVIVRQFPDSSSCRGDYYKKELEISTSCKRLEFAGMPVYSQKATCNDWTFQLKVE